MEVDRTVDARLEYAERDTALVGRSGIWIPACQPTECLDLILATNAAIEGSARYYLLPPSGVTTTNVGTAGHKPAQFGFVALPTTDESIESFAAGVGIAVVPEVSITPGRYLWRPHQSRLIPNLPAGQWGSLLPGASQAESASDIDAWIWLPHFGLVILEKQDRISAADLLKAPTIDSAVDQVRTLWKSPPQPPALPQRIAGFAVVDSDEAGAPLQDLASEFGQKAGELDKANPTGDGSNTGTGKGDGTSAGLADLASRGQAWALRKLEKWFQPDDSSESGDKDAKGNRAQQIKAAPSRSAAGPATGITKSLYEQLSKAVVRQREKQLNKLLQMSKTNPDEALKYAIPLAGDAAFRGLSIPGARLLPRTPSYSSGGASGPADFWGIDHELQKQLRDSYLEMANRETAAGRYRRAAYIYANLLADQASAAAVLEQGGHFREAATIYGEKLRRPDDQARCLMAAGLYEQAVEIFLARNDYLRAAEAWREAGEPEKAQQELRRAVQKLITSGQILKAANLLREELDSADEAMTLLWKQWPRGSEPLDASEEYFRLLASESDVPAVQVQLSDAIQRAGETHLLELALLCQRIASRFSGSELQATASDACRMAIAEGAGRFSPIEMDHATRALQRLEPQDPQLARDAARFKRDWDNTHRRASTVRRNRGKQEQITRLRPLLLEDENCVAFRRAGNTLAVIGESDNILSVRRYLSPEVISSRDVPVDYSARQWVQRANLRAFARGELGADIAEYSEQVFECERWTVRDVLVSDARDSSSSLVLRLDGAPVGDASKVLYEGNALPPSLSVSLSVPAPLATAIALARPDLHSWAGLAYEAGRWHLRTCGDNGRDLRSWALSDDAPSALSSAEDGWIADAWIEASTDAQLTSGFVDVLDGALVTAFGRNVIVGAETSNPRKSVVQGVVRCIAISPPNTRRRIAVGTDAGLEILWPGTFGQHLSLGDSQPFDHVLWMPGGRLFAVAHDRLYRYQIREGRVAAESTIQLLSHEVQNLVALSRSICGVCYKSGVIDRF